MTVHSKSSRWNKILKWFLICTLALIFIVCPIVYVAGSVYMMEKSNINAVTNMATYDNSPIPNWFARLYIFNFRGDKDDLEFLRTQSGLDPILENPCATRYKIASYLIDKGFDINTTDGSGRTALHLAVMGTDIEKVKWLIDRGADPSIKIGMWTLGTEKPEKTQYTGMNTIEYARHWNKSDDKDRSVIIKLLLQTTQDN